MLTGRECLLYEVLYRQPHIRLRQPVKFHQARYIRLNVSESKMKIDWKKFTVLYSLLGTVCRYI